MTDDGYAEVKKGVKDDDDDAALKKLAAQHERSVVSVEGDVTVVELDAKKAKASYRYQARIEQRNGETWRRVRSTSDSSKVDLVKQDGA